MGPTEEHPEELSEWRVDPDGNEYRFHWGNGGEEDWWVEYRKQKIIKEEK